MRSVIQRVSEASVKISNREHASIKKGFLIFVGIEKCDEKEDVVWLANKIKHLRIFSDAQGRMNLDIKETGGSILIISQFTLHAQTKKGNRPSFIRAAKPEKAIPLYEAFVQELKDCISIVKTGIFGSEMSVRLVNDGPVTILMDSRNKE